MNITKEQLQTIEAILSNDEASTDQELVEHFMNELGLSESDAKVWVNVRDQYLGLF